MDCLFLYTAAKVSNLKRKHAVDNIARSGKIPKIVNGAAKQASCKQVVFQKIKSCKSRASVPCPRSHGCARSSINGWEWHKWSINATPAERARVRGSRHVHDQNMHSESSGSQFSNAKGISARTNRVKLRNLLAAAEGADLLKATQLKVREGLHCFCFSCSYFNCLMFFFLVRHGKNVYVFNEARYMIGVWLHWSQLMQKILSLNTLEN